MVRATQNNFIKFLKSWYNEFRLTINYVKYNKYHAFYCFLMIHSVVLNYHKVILSLHNIAGVQIVML